MNTENMYQKPMAPKFKSDSHILTGKIRKGLKEAWDWCHWSVGRPLLRDDFGPILATRKDVTSSAVIRNMKIRFNYEKKNGHVIYDRPGFVKGSYFYHELVEFYWE